jgi:phage baseplate assembly protein gpV
VSRLVEIIKAIARHEVIRRPWMELGVVTSNFDDGDGDDSHTVSVTLKDSGVSLPRVPVAGFVTGGAALPRQDDVVLVAMPRGDLASAIVAGQVYSEKRRPPKFSRDEIALSWPGDAGDPAREAVDLRIKANGQGRSLTISLQGDKDARFTVTDGAIQLLAGGVEVRLSHSTDSDGVVSITGGGSKIELAQDGDVTIQASGALKLKASSIKIEGDTSVAINGQTVGIN